MSSERWTEIVIALLSILFGIAIWWPGELAPRASSFVGLANLLPRWIWGISLIGAGIIVVLAGTRWISPLTKRQMFAVLAVIWGLMTFSFVVNGVRLLGVALYAAFVLLLVGHFLLMPPPKKGI